MPALGREPSDERQRDGGAKTAGGESQRSSIMGYLDKFARHCAGPGRQVSWEQVRRSRYESVCGTARYPTHDVASPTRQPLIEAVISNEIASPCAIRLPAAVSR